MQCRKSSSSLFLTVWFIVTAELRAALPYIFPRSTGGGGEGGGRGGVNFTSSILSPVNNLIRFQVPVSEDGYF